jgi:hypothetical protein
MNVGRARLASQHIGRRTFESAADVVRWFGAIQAQDFLGALWAIGLRTKGATEASVEAAIERREIVRTWPMRGTLHFVAAGDVRWMTRLLTPRVIAGARSRHRQLELDAAVFTRSAHVAERLLVGGRRLRRDALYAAWNEAGIATGGSRGLHVLGYLAQIGVLCFGHREGKQHTVALLEEWVPSARDLEREEALGELARRYFTSHGPATVQDFAWWSGLTVAEARIGIDGARAALVSERIGNRTFWLVPSTAVRASTAAHLLPAWDEFTVAYRDRTDILDPRFALRVNAGGGVLKPVIVRRGQVVGTWQRTIEKRGVVVRPTFFARAGQAERAAVGVAARTYGRFLGLPAAIAR